MDKVKRLVQLSQSGQVEAFEELVLLYQDKIFGLSYHLTGNSTDAQDLAQETFVRAFASLKKFRNEADFGTYLHRITVNIWINQRRKGKNHQVFSLDSPLETGEGEIERSVAATTDSPEETFEKNEFRQVISKSLARLPQTHRAVLVLREIYGYSYEDISKILKCSPGTVKSRINRARQSMENMVINVAREEDFDLSSFVKDRAGEKNGPPSKKQI